MPPLALALILLSAVLHASWNLLIARARDTEAATALAVPIGALLVLPFTLSTWRVEAGVWPYLAATWVLETAYLALLAAAYRRADMSLVYPLARGLAPVIVLLVAALALGIPTTPLEALGVLGVGAGVLLVRGFGHGAAGSGDRAGTLLALTVAATIAGYTLVDRQGLQFASPTAYVVLALAVPGLVYLAAITRIKGRAAVRAELRPSTAFIGVAMFAGFGAALAALTIAPPASVAAGRESSVVIATVMAAVVLKERVGPRRLAGAVLVVIGVALLAVG